MTLLPTLLATIPLLAFFILLLWKKTPLVWASFITLVLVVFEAILYWKIFPDYLLASAAKGFFVALDIFIIIIGAIFFLEVTKEAGIIKNISYYFGKISKDIRIQVIFLAWFLENFLEGTAGFGTPSTVVAPLLVGLGINPLNAVIIALLGNSTSVAFGAAGTPIKVGFGSLAGINLPLQAAIINSVGILIPVFMLWFLLRGKDKKYFIEVLPLALWSGLVFVISSILIIPLGQEFPSILGSVFGLVIVLATVKLGLFVPKSTLRLSENEEDKPSLPPWKVLLPYFLLILLLVAGKFILSNEGFVISLLVKHNFAFFNPGFIFIITGIVSAFVFKIKFSQIILSLRFSLRKSVEPFLVIAFMSAMSQIMVNSYNNPIGVGSMIDSLAIHVKNVFLPFLAPFVGAFGSFLTGSATVSNLMFGNFLATAAKELSFNVDNILALALVGGAVGNMVALADILVAEAVVGIKHKEREVINGVIVPCLICLVLVSFVGMIVF